MGFGKSWPAFLAMPFVGFLAACTIVPTGTSANIPLADEGRRAIGQKSDDLFSGAFVASETVPWPVPPTCRNSFNWNTLDESVREAIKQDADKNGIWPASNKFWDKYCRITQPGTPFDKDFIALALSGGGLRAAVFSAAVMFELEKYGVLAKADVISSVSGGAMTAAYYALSCDDRANCPETVEGPERCLWRADESDTALCDGGVFDRLNKNFELSWIGNWFWPDNILRYWFTHFDRSDIMVETLADNLYDNSLIGNEGYRFHDLNPQRPTLIINATNFTHEDTTVEMAIEALRTGAKSRSAEEQELLSFKFLEHLNFKFTKEEYRALCSSLDQYPIANAVMASSAFPAVFQYITLSNYRNADCRGEPSSYTHIFDGGNSDNLGLLALETILKKIRDEGTDGSRPVRPDRIIVFEVDASLGFLGQSPADPDPREWLDYFVDTNFLDSVDSLMLSGYTRSEKAIDKLIDDLVDNNGDRVHIALRDLKDVPGEEEQWRNYVSKIATRYKTDSERIKALRHAACVLVRRKMDEVCDRFMGLCTTPPPGAPCPAPPVGSRLPD